MRPWHLLLLFACLIVVDGCASAPRSTPFTASTYQPEGDYAHVLTGLAFPMTIGPYTRMGIGKYDPDAYNVSGGYELGEPHWGIATVYHYPATPDASFPTYAMLTAHFAEAKRSVISALRNVTIVEEGESDLMVNGVSLKGRRATFSADAPEGIEGPLVTSIHLYALENWYLKFRFSHSEIDSEPVARYEQQFMQAIRWPTPEGAQARPHLAQCVDLANTYELVARNKDLGLSEEQMYGLLGESGKSRREQRQHLILTNAISVAVAFPEHTSLQIRSLVLRDCTRDGRGGVQLNQFWPWIKR